MEAKVTEAEAGHPTPKSAQTRQRILDAAAEVLSRKGYAGTRLTDVAAVAGVQAPAIYYYFSSRDELVEEVMWVGAHLVRTHVAEVLEALPPESSHMDRLMVAVDAHLRFELQLSDYATASIRNAGHVPEQLRVRPAAEEALYSRLWRDLFAAAQQAGEIRADLDINVFRLLLLGAMNWVVEWWNPRTRSLDELVATAQAMVRHGAAAE
ncbi:TetR/AcrR family transcriptional regulator [Demequina sp. SYSU T00192]|uniref:TetR/AcrR family transcriptional regulator n=1 Tax=Demequina litoralis TaxID=3051660 RepID=A0ABT8G6B8_9MICO|nr:TetR/AcrR family transcriptional regulator [Demequina sp. SYSU T00192]MDN4474666.1 TetR/AcrR family transcriptional regulator [Demequina sp. SYSU T00192]